MKQPLKKLQDLEKRGIRGVRYTDEAGYIADIYPDDYGDFDIKIIYKKNEKHADRPAYLVPKIVYRCKEFYCDFETINGVHPTYPEDVQKVKEAIAQSQEFVDTLVLMLWAGDFDYLLTDKENSND